MARTTRAKKQAEAPKVNIGTEIFESLRDLEKLKGIPVDYMVERLKQALVNAYRRDREDHRVLPADNVVVNLNEDGLTMFQVKTAMAEPEDWALEIPIDAARNYKPDAQEGDAIYIPVDIAKFGRIAAQTAKHGATYHDKPTFKYPVNGGEVVCYSVGNMPGAVARTSTFTLTNATMPYMVDLANKGWKKACQDDKALARGINTYDGKVYFKGVSDALGYELHCTCDILK